MPTFKQVVSTDRSRIIIAALVMGVALLALSLGVPQAGGCGGVAPTASPGIETKLGANASIRTTGVKIKTVNWAAMMLGTLGTSKQRAMT